MKKGILLINGFLKAEKYNEIYNWLSSAATAHNIELVIKSNSDFLVLPDGMSIYPKPDKCDFILFWDKDIALARAFEHAGYKVYNSANAIEICDNKALTFEALSGKVRMPKTYRIPKTFPKIGYTDLGFLDLLEDTLGYPYIIKECCGSFGAQVYMANSKDEAVTILDNTSGAECIAQEYIKSSFGRDVRIHTVGNEVVTSMIRYNENDFRANITNGGSMLSYEPDDAHIKMALEVADIIGLDFAGIDILFGEDDEPILCEVNSNAHFRNIYDCTKVNVADIIISYIVNKL